MKRPGPDGNSTAHGYLLMPKVADGEKVSAVVLLHGSGGIRKAMPFVHGDADDYVPIGCCCDYSALVAKAGTPVQFLALAGGHHKFDDDSPRRIYLARAARTLEACPPGFDIDTGIFVDRVTGQRIPGDQMDAVNKQSCCARGASVEGNTRLRAQAAEAIAGFLATAFAR
jgi:hypothetical protein